jgi:predicted ribosome quality control (RQC) complex YloA/Tae2 family protein
LDDETKVIVGRNEEENSKMRQFVQDEHCLIEALDVGSPLTLLIGSASDENIRMAAQITARYSSAKNEPEVRTLAGEGDSALEILVTPADDDEIARLSIR